MYAGVFIFLFIGTGERIPRVLQGGAKKQPKKSSRTCAKFVWRGTATTPGIYRQAVVLALLCSGGRVWVPVKSHAHEIPVSGDGSSRMNATQLFGNDDNKARIRFYHGSMDNYTELIIDEAEKIFSTSWYDPSKTTVMFCHGFTGYPDGPAIKGVVSAFLSLGKSNVALVNWQKLAGIALPGLINSYLNWALPNSIQLGADLAKALWRMSAAGLNLNNTHFVGHSLGAHIFGIAGNEILKNGSRLPWISALDPAIGFDMKPEHQRLNPKSAAYVSVLHADPNKFGSAKEMGVADFWPNYRNRGPVLQPGCPRKTQRFSDEDFCSHNRAWQLFVDAILHPGTVLASHAKNVRVWNKYTKEERRANVLEVGVYPDNPVPGNYYFVTAEESPYGLGEDGL